MDHSSWTTTLSAPDKGNSQPQPQQWTQDNSDVIYKIMWKYVDYLFLCPHFLFYLIIPVYAGTGCKFTYFSLFVNNKVKQ